MHDCKRTLRGLAAVATLIASAAMPGCSTTDNAGRGFMPGGKIPGMPGGSSLHPHQASLAPAPQQPDQPAAAMAAPPAIAQVAHQATAPGSPLHGSPVQTADYQSAGDSAADGSQVVPVGWGQTHRGSATASAPCGPHDAAGGCSCCSKSAYFTAGPWNKFGIDPQEFLCDGGDYAANAHVRKDDAIVGIDLEDTVVKYTTEAGDIHVQPSNRVCLYAPRFAAVRKVTAAAAGGRAIGAKGYDLPEGPGRIDLNQPSSAVTAQHSPERQVAARGLDAMRDRNRGVPVENVDQPLLAADTLAVLSNLSLITRGQLTEADKPWLAKGALAAEIWTMEEIVAVTVNDVKPVEQIRNAAAEGLTVYEFPDAGRLRIVKLADKQNALPGDIVTFILRVDNVGDSAVHDVVLTDNLTTRLEYVEGSQTCSAGARFETEDNRGASLRLTWTLTDTLKVGESATIRFRCKVR
ncbi:DUF11 domain-containing protein [Roseimaritima ulvae]|uniref:DUF11 domain-containing protein n=1 Tax=Roseimaritima ulvae TaxID=980254 RepID=A0A5B9QJC3_9BACT|nr:DUF11 domain-containing protein [Roseimaritima ulvae]QEG39004.1 hypothetical protein UC8_09650 [Roseimaritima ulvae]